MSIRSVIETGSIVSSEPNRPSFHHVPSYEFQYSELKHARSVGDYLDNYHQDVFAEALEKVSRLNREGLFKGMPMVKGTKETSLIARDVKAGWELAWWNDDRIRTDMIIILFKKDENNPGAFWFYCGFFIQYAQTEDES